MSGLESKWPIVDPISPLSLLIWNVLVENLFQLKVRFDMTGVSRFRKLICVTPVHCQATQQAIQAVSKG